LGHDGACPSICNRAETQRVQTKFGTRAHRENVANDSANAGGRALKRLDRARVIMTLDLERNRPAVTNVDDAGIFFASLDENVRTGRREFFQFFS